MDFFARTCCRFSHLLAWLLILCVSGCAPTQPGETFFAGYISPDKQTKLSHTFTVKNTTSGPVEIRSVDKNCSCTSFELGKYRLARGESTTLTVNVDVLRSFMKRTSACILRTDNPKFKDWAYEVTFVSAPFAVAEPGLLNLGSFKQGPQSPEAANDVTLDLFAESEIELAQENFTVPEEIELNVLSKSDARSLQPDMWKTTYKISMGLSAKGRQIVSRNLGTGLVTKIIELKVNKPKPRTWQYSVYWQTLASLQSHPSSLSFGNVLDPGDNKSRRVVISSTTGESFRLLSIKSQHRDIQIEPEFDAANESPRQVVSFNARTDAAAETNLVDGRRRFFTGTIQVQTTDKSQPFLEIPWSATRDPLASPPPEISPPKLGHGKGALISGKDFS
jgi:hypothetical protein